MNKVVSIALQTISLIGINVFYFGVLEVFSASRWVCWAYIHLTYILIVAAIYSVKAVHNGHVYAYPKIVTATIYYFVALIVGVILMLINFESIVVPIIVFLIFTGIYLKLYLTLMATESASIANEKRDRAHLHFIKQCSERLQAIKEDVKDLKIKKTIERAYDAIRGAAVASIPKVTELEIAIEEQIDALDAAVATNSLENVESSVGKLITLIRKRDAEIRLSK